MKKAYYIETFGCQMNVHDSEKIAGILKKDGYTEADNPQDADIIVFNTCSIRAKAEQKFFSKLGRLKTQSFAENSRSRVHCPAGGRQDIAACALH